VLRHGVALGTTAQYGALATDIPGVLRSKDFVEIPTACTNRSGHVQIATVLPHTLSARGDLRDGHPRWSVHPLRPERAGVRSEYLYSVREPDPRKTVGEWRVRIASRGHCNQGDGAKDCRELSLRVGQLSVSASRSLG
jgi:hypothetical protein